MRAGILDSENVMPRRKLKSRWASPEAEAIAEKLVMEYGFADAWITPKTIDLYKAAERKRQEQQKCQQQNQPQTS